MRLSHFALAACLFVLPIAGATTICISAFAAATVSELGDLSATGRQSAGTLCSREIPPT
jgi:hypothetical protein